MKSGKLIAVILSVAFSLSFGSPASAEQVTVLIIYSYDKELAWTQQCDRGITEVLPGNVLIERLYMDTKRIPKEQFEGKARTILDEFKSIQPNLVMVSDDNALRLVGPEIAATGVPLVYLGINGNPRDYFGYLPMNVAGVIERVPLSHWIRLLFEIVPRADSLLVLMDDSPTADSIIKSSLVGKKTIDFDGRAVEWKKAKDWEHWQQLVLNKKNGIILMPIYHALKDVNGVHVPYDKVITWTSENSRVPVFATQDYAVGDQGVVGAFVILGEEHGRIAGSIAMAILNGKPIQDLLTADDQQGSFYFNLKQLKRFGLALPKQIREQATIRK